MDKTEIKEGGSGTRKNLQDTNVYKVWLKKWYYLLFKKILMVNKVILKKCKEIYICSTSNTPFRLCPLTYLIHMTYSCLFYNPKKSNLYVSNLLKVTKVTMTNSRNI